MILFGGAVAVEPFEWWFAVEQGCGLEEVVSKTSFM